MIGFLDLNKDAHLAQAMIKRSSGVNGSLSLSGEIFAGPEVLSGIDAGWRLMFDGDEYTVSYKKLNNKTKTVEFDAIQSFFWDFSKVALHEQWNGSHTFEAYLKELFLDSDYTYKLDVDVAAFEKENWGYKNKLALFNDIISTADVEFEVHNNIIHIVEQIGSDLTTIARTGINLSDLTEEMQIANFATYGKGYGAYTDENDHDKGRLEVEYESELSKKYGRLEADPIVDERYTVADNLKAAVKDAVDATYAVSVALNLYDLKSAGYANYESPTCGDFLMAIDESLNFQRQIRIIKLDESFDVKGKLIGYTATCGDLTAAEQYQAALGGTNSTIEKIQEQIDFVALSANGKSKNYWGNTEPINPKDGDIWFDESSSDPDKWVIKQWKNGRWEQITLGKNEVTDAIKAATADLPKLKSDIEASLSASNLAVANAGFAQDTADEAKKLATETATNMATALDAAKTAGDNATTALTNASQALALANGANSTSTALKTDVDTIKGTLKSVAMQEDVDVLKGTVKDQSTTLEQTVSGLKLKADNTTVETLSQTVTDQSASLNTMAGQIKLKADSTTVNKITGDVSALSAQVNTQAGQIDLMASKTDIAGMATQSYVQAQTKIVSDSITSTVSALTSTVNAMGQVNQLNNTEWDPDLSGWTFWLFNGGIKTVRQDISRNGSRVLNMGSPATSDTNIKDKPTVGFVSGWIPVTPGWKVSVSIDAIRYWVPTDGTDNSARVQLQYANTSNTSNFDLPADMSKYGDGILNFYANSTNNQWQTYKVSSTVPDGMLYVRLYGWVKGVHSDLNISRPMIVVDQDVGAYVPGRYNNNIALTALSQKVDSIEAIASDGKDKISNLQVTVNGLQATAKDSVTQAQLTLLNNQLTSTITSVNNIVKGNLLLGTANSLSVTGTGNANQGCGKYTLQHDALGQQVTLSFAITASSDGGTFIPQTGDGYPTWQLSGVTSVPIKKGWNWYTYTFVLGPETDKTKSLTVQWRLDNFPVGATFTVSTASVTLGTSAPRFWSVNPSELAASSQITQLQDDINLRVKKGDVVSQFNIDAGQTLIQSNKLYLDTATVVFSGKAFIPTAVIKDLSVDTFKGQTINGNTMNIINVNGANIVSQSITADKLAANAIQVGLQNFSSTMKITPTSLTINNGAHDVFQLNQTGIHVWDPTNNKETGWIHSNTIVGHSDLFGLQFDLNNGAHYMGWAYQESAGANYTHEMVWYDTYAANKLGVPQGFHFNHAVDFEAGISIKGAYQQLGYATSTFNGTAYPYFGSNKLTAGIAYGTSDIYVISGTSTYDLTKFIKSVNALTNCGHLAIPTAIRSDGTVSNYTNFTF